MIRSFTVVALVLTTSIIGLAHSAGQGKGVSTPQPQKVVIQGKILNKLTGKPVKSYGCMVTISNTPKHNRNTIVYGWSKGEKFKAQVNPGKYYLVLSEVRHIRTIELPSLPERAEWAEIVGNSHTPFCAGSRIEVEAKSGQVRTFLFRLKTVANVD